MAVTPLRGKFHVEYYPKTASTAFTKGDMVELVPTAAGVGKLALVTSSSASVLGTIQKEIASTDSDYASETMVPVLVGDADAEWLAETTTNAGQSEVGQFIDVSDEDTLDGGTAYTYGVALVTQYFSTTSLGVKFCKKSGPAITTA